MIPPPEVQGTSCTRYRMRYSECRTCEEACPHDAIRLSHEGVAIAEDRCRRCGLCVAACPTETLGMPSLAPLALIEKASGRNELCIACEPSQEEGDIRVPCLGAVGAAALASIARQGTAVRLRGSEHCVHCEHGRTGSERLNLHLAALAALREASCEEWAAVRIVDGARKRRNAPGRPALGRRAFLRRIADPAGQQGASSTAAPVPLRAVRAARSVACAQRGLLQQLGLSEGRQALPAHPAVFAGQVQLHAGCTGCEACARACPTGALQVRESDTRWGLVFDAGACVGCAVCVESCQPAVLELAGELNPAAFAANSPAALLVRPMQRCQRCDRKFVSAGPEALCTVCVGDEQDFEAIFG